MKNVNYTFKAIIIAILYWLMDSAIHGLVYSEEGFEFIPSELNELFMRITIVVLLIAFGMYADRQTKAMLKKEKEKRIIFNATVSSTQHILNNLLNQMQFFKMKADESNVFDENITDLYEQSIEEGKELVEKLSTVEELSEENIKASVHLKMDK